MSDNKTTIIQAPNLSLSITLAAAVLGAIFRSGWLHTTSRIVYVVAGVIWSLQEIIAGDSWFRRVLGAIVLIMIVLSVMMHGVS